MSVPEENVKMCKLLAADGVLFKCSLKAVRRAKTINNLINDLAMDIEDIDNWEPIPLKNLEPHIVSKVITFLEYHKNDPVVPDDDIDGPKPISEWDEQFLRVPQDRLHEIIRAANYLDIFILLDVACQKIANMIRGKNVTQIRRIYNIPNDMTRAEEEHIMREGAWSNRI